MFNEHVIEWLPQNDWIIECKSAKKVEWLLQACEEAGINVVLVEGQRNLNQTPKNTQLLLFTVLKIKLSIKVWRVRRVH